MMLSESRRLIKRIGQIFEFLFHVRKKKVFWCEIFQKSPKKSMETPIVSCRHPRGSAVDFGDFSRFFMDFRSEKCFFNLSGPISMRNFTGNPFLMVSERSGHAKLVKTSKNKFFGEIIDILEVDPHLESR